MESGDQQYLNVEKGIVASVLVTVNVSVVVNLPFYRVQVGR